eukprot:Awhi_evm2s12209
MKFSGIFTSLAFAIPLVSAQYLGEIKLVGFNFAPVGWALCDGQELQISEHSALYSLLGVTYGGDGRSTFNLPDLRGRAPVHSGSGPGLTTRSWGDAFGTETHTLTANEGPSHTHGLTDVNVVDDSRRSVEALQQATSDRRRSEGSCESTGHDHDFTYEVLEENETEEYQITFKNKRAVDTFARKNRNQTTISKATKFETVSKSGKSDTAQLSICSGINGQDGLNGQPGPQGQTGPQGPTGPPGPTGPQGPAGADGVDGLNGGVDGIDGADGADGPVGPVGPQGPAGNNGLDGAAGPVGPAGNNGLDGAAGPVGPQGPAGNNGLDGAVGPVGPQGPAGNNGLDGAAGPVGPQGPTGAVGPQGPTGASASAESLSVDSAGSGAAHANVQPSLSMYYIIRTTLDSDFKFPSRS